ncbi:MAG: glycoside hydrolase family 2 protein, partial [Lachnospiraceae bacterium]|nr:glycoside hydrolase family 2 protein [Lachnospiraceae bacterium]
MRIIKNFNEDWYFVKAADLSAAQSMEREAVVLPHTWNSVDGQDGGNDYFRGTCLYIKDFKKPGEWQEGNRVFLEFHGAAMTAAVSVNDKLLKTHEGGYSTFRVDITEALEEENQVCVSVDNSANTKVYPQKADFTFYGGLYRDVNLICVPEKHFELEKDGTPGIKVTPVVEGSAAKVKVEVWVCGQGDVTFTL